MLCDHRKEHETGEEHHDTRDEAAELAEAVLELGRRRARRQLARDSARSLSGAYTFFLEEYGLKPGDFISYYAKARDASNEATSDIYFIEVKPFEMEYKQSQQGGGQGQDVAELAVPDPLVVAQAWDAWRAEADFATQLVAAAPSLDITAGDPGNRHGSGGGSMSLREVLVGMIEEYARHMGHADLLRERIDGRLGQ